MNNKHIKKCSTHLALREMKIKATLRFHLTYARMAMIGDTDINTGCFRLCDRRMFVHWW